jgi:hypothetical protein
MEPKDSLPYSQRAQILRKPETHHCQCLLEQSLLLSPLLAWQQQTWPHRTSYSVTLNLWFKVKWLSGRISVSSVQDYPVNQLCCIYDRHNCNLLMTVGAGCNFWKGGKTTLQFSTLPLLFSLTRSLNHPLWHHPSLRQSNKGNGKVCAAPGVTKGYD